MAIIKENYPLKNHNTFRIEVFAKYFAECNTVTEIVEILGEYPDIPLLILGGGSNILFTCDFDGIVICPCLKKINIITENEDKVIIKVGAGMNWDSFVKYCVDNGFGGLENLSLIPGNVGSSPIQNIGAYGVEVNDTILEVEGFEINRISLKKYINSECKFVYRSSIFKTNLKNKVIITSVIFQLNKNPEYQINYNNINIYIRRRDLAVNLPNGWLDYDNNPQIRQQIETQLLSELQSNNNA